MLLSLIGFSLAAEPDAAWLFSTWAEHSRLQPPASHNPAPPRGGGDLLSGYQSGDIFILKDEDGEWFAEAVVQLGSGNFEYITNSVIDGFYNYNEDKYDYVNILLLQDFGLFFAFYQPIANDVLGIGYDSVTPGEVFDSDGSNKLDGLIFMNYEGLWTDNPLSGRYVFGQEFMHRWGSFTDISLEGVGETDLLGRDVAHWSYWLHTSNSPMEGNSWVDNGDGTWTTDLSAPSTYSELDLYLMGFAGPEEVPEQTLLLVSEEEQARISREPASSPAYFDCVSGFGACLDVTVTASSVNFGMDAIIAAEGERVPSVEDSPREFRMAFIILALTQDVVDEAAIARVDNLRQTWESDWEEDVQGRADLITSLDASTAPTWGEEVEDSSPTDSSLDSSSVDTSQPNESETSKEEPKACGCSAVDPLGSMILLGALGLVGRRRE